jgi:hypothetical protein
MHIESWPNPPTGTVCKSVLRDIFCRKIKIDDFAPVGSNEHLKDSTEVRINLVSLV